MASEHGKDGDEAAALVSEVLRDNPEILSTQTSRDELTAAIQIDLASAQNTAMRDDERIVKLETQTQALTDAVIAISEAAAPVNPAIAALKADTPDAK